jgi:hypothetical protein
MLRSRARGRADAVELDLLRVELESHLGRGMLEKSSRALEGRLGRAGAGVEERMGI